MGMASLYGGGPPDRKTAKEFGLKFDPQGSGWCFWPHNYDPVWIDGPCLKFSEKG